MKNILKIGLLVLAVVLSYFIFRSVQGLVDFNRDKIQRYVVAAEQLQDLANAERLYRGYHGEFTDNLDSLKNFVETGKILVINRKDSSAYVYDKRKRIDVMKSFTIFDTIVSPTSVRDSVFGDRSMENFGFVPIDGEKIPIKLYASYNDRIVGEDSTNIQRDHFFMGSVPRKDVLAGLGDDYIARELEDPKAVIKEDLIKVGSDFRPSLEGNWSSDIDLAMKERRNRLENLRLKQNK